MIFIITEEKKTDGVFEKVIKLIEARLDYLLACHNEGNAGDAIKLIKTDELIKLANLIMEMKNEGKEQSETGENEETDEIRFVLDKAVRRLAK